MTPFLLRGQSAPRPVAIVIHGGAGGMVRGRMSPEREAALRAKLTEALMAGYKVLVEGGSSLDAVEKAIRVLEDSPLFNAGKGAVFTSAGRNELDASIMDGRTLNAGAVAGVRRVKNPISLARLVMERSPHVLLAGEGAEAFAREQGMELVPEAYFRAGRSGRRPQEGRGSGREKRKAAQGSKKEHGTVGAAALDREGNLAAGTSTGGMSRKRPGRIGDSPIIGAGTYANNRTCAVSATGHGEYFIRLAAAHDVSALMEYKGMSVQEAAAAVIAKVGRLGGSGGVIALDRQGRMAVPFNTPGMYRAYIDAEGRPVVRIYRGPEETRR